jgi:hypothetical protein
MRGGTARRSPCRSASPSPSGSLSPLVTTVADLPVARAAPHAGDVVVRKTPIGELVLNHEAKGGLVYAGCWTSWRFPTRHARFTGVSAPVAPTRRPGCRQPTESWKTSAPGPRLARHCSCTAASSSAAILSKAGPSSSGRGRCLKTSVPPAGSTRHSRARGLSRDPVANILA